MDLRLQYAPEIERALVGLVWHEPFRLPLVLRELNLSLHFFEPATRILLEAINTVYGELNAADWATVVELLRQMDQLDECGGLERLNEIYARPGYQTLLDYYIQALKEYALIRDSTPIRAADFLSGGRGVLRIHKRKTHVKAPDMIGSAHISGHSYVLSAWIAETADGLQEFQIIFEFKARRKSHGPLKTPR